MTTTTTTARPRRGHSQPLRNGLRRNHDVTCTLAGTPDGCTCPYVFWKPRCTPRKRVRVVGTEQEALTLREHMQREASGTIHLTSYTPAPGAQPAAPFAKPAPTQHTPTFGEWARQVMETIWLKHSATTRQSRTSIYRNHVHDDFAHVDLADVTAQFVEAWLADLTRRGVSLHMQRQAYDVVRTITGHWHEQAGQPNPVAVVKRPITPPAQEKRAKDSTITAQQYQSLIAACKTTAEELLIRTATEAGLRLNELCGLQRRDIELTKRTITVKRQGSRSVTKTGHSRTIHIVTDELTACFDRHLTDLTNAGFTMPDAYIWQGGHGPRLPENNRPFQKQGIYRNIRKILKRVDLDEVTRPHGLRATGAKLLIEAGASMPLVSQHLGHATTRTTEDYYVGTVKTDGLASFAGAFGG